MINLLEGKEGKITNHHLPLLSGLSSLGLCKKCFSFRYDEMWHQKAPKFPAKLRNKFITLRILLCPDCRYLPAT